MHSWVKKTGTHPGCRRSLKHSSRPSLPCLCRQGGACDCLYVLCKQYKYSIFAQGENARWKRLRPQLATAGDSLGWGRVARFQIKHPLALSFHNAYRYENVYILESMIARSKKAGPMPQQSRMTWTTPPNLSMQAQSRYEVNPCRESRRSLKMIPQIRRPAPVCIEGVLEGHRHHRRGGEEGPFPGGYSGRRCFSLALLGTAFLLACATIAVMAIG